MSQDAADHATADHASAHSLQGTVVRPRSEEERLRVMEWAFDYRGDVTLELAGSESVCGYVCNRVAAGAESCLELLLPGRPGLLKVFCRDIQSVRFTGEDTASGRSWEAWMRKKREEKESGGASSAPRRP